MAETIVGGLVLLALAIWICIRPHTVPEWIKVMFDASTDKPDPIDEDL